MSEVVTSSTLKVHHFLPRKESTDYSILFYMYDGYFLLAAVLMIWLSVTLERSGQSTLEALKKIWNKSALIVFSLLFILGIQWGVQDSYVLVYLTDEMGASSQLTSERCLKVFSRHDAESSSFACRYHDFCRSPLLADWMHIGQEDRLPRWRVEYGFLWHFRGKCSTDDMGPSEVSSSLIVMPPLTISTTRNCLY